MSNRQHMLSLASKVIGRVSHSCAHGLGTYRQQRYQEDGYPCEYKNYWIKGNAVFREFQPPVHCETSLQD